jgi:two-component system, chemotaxis family, CheB/CheR fusion protein
VNKGESSPEPSDDFIVVGVGASAGGVEALEQLFASMPKRINAAFVVLTHLGRNRESVLGEIIARHTTLPVATASDDQEMQAGHIYVLPSDHILTLSGRNLRLHAVAGQRERNPIDVFFAAMAHEHRENSVAVVLSGAGYDGTLGVRAIKEEGGLTIAQGHNGTSPAYESMPMSAIATGLVDMVLPVEQIGPKLQEYLHSLLALNAIVDENDQQRHEAEFDQALLDIHALLRKRAGHDFTSYKEKTLLRRVQRRMQITQMSSLSDYVGYARAHCDESMLLFRDLLIGVTNFFRDPEAFETLASRVVPKLFENVGAADVVRVWVPGCATGEEAYSIAILLRERMLSGETMPRVQVFATDIDESALAAARAGRYPAAMLENVSPERLKRFFRREAESYVLTKEVRDLCIFSSHSVVRDPPFSRMALISCRNLLIYFNAELQDNVLPVFHYALRPDGYLLLGPAESVSRHGDLFAVVDKKQRIYQKRVAVNATVRIPSWLPGSRSEAEGRSDTTVRRDQHLRQYIEGTMLETFTPAHIVVEADGNIVYYSSRTGKYLEAQVGSPNRQILSMARQGLRLELRTALREAAEQGQLIVRERVEIELEDRVQFVRLSVQPLIQGDQETLYLVVLTDLGPPMSRADAAQRPSLGSASGVAGLEKELRETRDRLQATIEEYETALEELKSGNEEMVSVNEELQSTNEELETSKEELQSVNEELQTINSELGAKIEQLDRANGDLRNLFDSTQIATVFLDRFMVIRSYTPAVTSIFNLIPGDRGRPITDIVHQLENVDIPSEVRRVLDERKPFERPVRVRDSKRFYLMRLLPYRADDEHIDGALVTFVNVSEVVAAEEQQRMLVGELNHRVRNMLQVVIGLANQTLHRSEDLKQFEKSFMGRMQALARAYELVSRDGWHKVHIAELLDTQLAPFATEKGRYTAEGEPLLLAANAALALGLVLYELATNATKYGALSVPTGRIRVSWILRQQGEQQVLVFSWMERGGPKVTPPTHHGFGSELVQRQLRYELNGKAAMQFSEAGLEVTVEIPAGGVVVAALRPSAVG